MRLEYRILCVDNDISSLETPKSTLSSVNTSVGVLTKYIDLPVEAGARENQADFRVRIKKEFEKAYEENGPFDLVLIDLHMQDGGEREEIKDPINGPDFVQMVRDHTMYKPIIFYSGGKNPATDENARNQLHEAIEEAQIWGKNLMICPRNDLPNFLENLLKEMHEEEHKVNNVRGRLMDSVSEIDAKIILRLRSDDFWRSIPIENTTSILTFFKRQMRRKAKSSKDLSDTIEAMDFSQMADFFKEKDNDRKTEMITKSEILRECLRVIPYTQESGETLSGFYNGSESLASARNAYAHKTAKELSGQHNVGNFKIIREECRRHLQNICKISGDDIK